MSISVARLRWATGERLPKGVHTGLETMSFKLNPLPQVGHRVRIYLPPDHDEPVDVVVVDVVHEISPAALHRDPLQEVCVYVRLVPS
jgi:hypothetical protein